MQFSKLSSLQALDVTKNLLVLFHLSELATSSRRSKETSSLKVLDSVLTDNPRHLEKISLLTKTRCEPSFDKEKMRSITNFADELKSLDAYIQSGM